MRISTGRFSLRNARGACCYDLRTTGRCLETHGQPRATARAARSVRFLPITAGAPARDGRVSIVIRPLKTDIRSGPGRQQSFVESRCGAVAVDRTYLLPPLSSGGASLVLPWLRFHTPLIEPDRQISRIRLSDKTPRRYARAHFRVQRHLQFLNTFGVDRLPNLHVLHYVLRSS